MKQAARKKTKQITRTKPYHYKGCGLDNVYLHGGVTYVDTPRGKAVHIENLEDLHRAIGQWLVHEKKNLTGKEFRFLRHEINLTQQGLADLLNTDVQNVGRWEREEAEKVPGPAQAVVRLLYDEQVNGSRAISEPLHRLADLNERRGEGKEIKFQSRPEGWSIAA